MPRRTEDSHDWPNVVSASEKKVIVYSNDSNGNLNASEISLGEAIEQYVQGLKTTLVEGDPGEVSQDH